MKLKPYLNKENKSIQPLIDILYSDKTLSYDKKKLASLMMLIENLLVTTSLKENFKYKKELSEFSHTLSKQDTFLDKIYLINDLLDINSEKNNLEILAKNIYEYSLQFIKTNIRYQTRQYILKHLDKEKLFLELINNYSNIIILFSHSKLINFICFDNVKKKQLINKIYSEFESIVIASGSKFAIAENILDWLLRQSLSNKEDFVYRFIKIYNYMMYKYQYSYDKKFDIWERVYNNWDFSTGSSQIHEMYSHFYEEYINF